MVLLSFPTVVDDSGDGQSGTVIDEAFVTDIQTAIENLIHSGTNPTIAPNDIIDEVVTARGNKASLNARLAGVIDADGALVTSASVVSQANAQALMGAVNLLANDTFLIWSAGDSSAPDFFVLAGAGAAVARTGALQFGSESSAPAENTKKKVGNFAAKLSGGAAEATLTQTLLDTAAYPGSTNVFNGRTFGFGCWVWSADAGGTMIRFSDGSQTTNSSEHTGNSTWQWLSGTHTVVGGATKLEMSLVTDVGGVAYFSGATCMLSPFAPTLWVPSPKIYREVLWFLVGNPAAATKLFEYTFARPALIKDVHLAAIAAPTVSALICDVNKGTGGTSMFSTRPQIAAAALSGSARPDALYASRCFAKDNVVSVDVDADDGGNTCTGLGVHIRFMQYARPLEDFLAHDDI